MSSLHVHTTTSMFETTTCKANRTETQQRNESDGQATWPPQGLNVNLESQSLGHNGLLIGVTPNGRYCGSTVQPRSTERPQPTPILPALRLSAKCTIFPLLFPVKGHQNDLPTLFIMFAVTDKPYIELLQKILDVSHMEFGNTENFYTSFTRNDSPPCIWVQRRPIWYNFAAAGGVFPAKISIDVETEPKTTGCLASRTLPSNLFNSVLISKGQSYYGSKRNCKSEKILSPSCLAYQKLTRWWFVIGSILRAGG